MPNIVLIEDNPILLKLWTGHLQEKGHMVRSAGTPEEGQALLAKGPPDILMIDNILPRMDGLDLIEAFRQQYPEASTFVVLMVMHPERAEDMTDLRRRGVTQVWVKNMCEVTLDVRLEALLKGEETVQRLADPALLDSLVAGGYITLEQKDKALTLAQRDTCLAEQALVEMGAVPPDLAPWVMELAFKTDYLPLSKIHPQPAALAALPVTLAAKHKALPLTLTASKLRLSMADPRDLPTIDLVARLTGHTIEAVYGPKHEIETAIMVHYGGARASAHANEVAAAAAQFVKKQGVSFLNQNSLEEEVSERPTVELVDSILVSALEQRASDIHIEPHMEAVVIRYRIDGVLHDEKILPSELADSLAARVKILGNMDVSERRLPQDGRYQVCLQGRVVDFRISSIPVMEGEKIVMRVLDRSVMQVALENIGFTGQQLPVFLSLIERAYGLVLVTGPTGSGKTSTLYAALNHLRSTTLNLVSIEDPVEYRLDRVNQIQVREHIGLTFGNVLRSVLRQDPNVILVGEIRDRETAELAVQAALTGHLVLATLHTNDAPGALIRLTDMGVPDYLVASTVTAVLAQRLVRRNCAGCSEEVMPGPPAELEALHAQGSIHLVQGKGCEACRGTGYRGRMAVFELLELTETLRRAFLQHPQSVYRLVREEGMSTMRDNALVRVLEGSTTLSEVNRVSVVERADAGHAFSHSK